MWAYLQLELKNEKSKMKGRKDEGVNEEWRQKHNVPERYADEPNKNQKRTK